MCVAGEEEKINGEGCCCYREKGKRREEKKRKEREGDVGWAAAEIEENRGRVKKKRRKEMRGVRERSVFGLVGKSKEKRREKRKRKGREKEKKRKEKGREMVSGTCVHV
jgi:hypothetical protein